MKNINKYRIPILVNVLSFAIAFFSISLIPISQLFGEGVEKWMGYVIAAIFWLSLIFGFVSIRLTTLKFEGMKNKAIKLGLHKEQRLPGIISFGLSVPKIIIYAVTLIGLILIITDLIFTWVPSYIMFPILSITLFAFALHCIADGENYKVYKFIKEGMNNGGEQ